MKKIILCFTIFALSIALLSCEDNSNKKVVVSSSVDEYLNKLDEGGEVDFKSVNINIALPKRSTSNKSNIPESEYDFEYEVINGGILFKNLKKQFKKSEIFDSSIYSSNFVKRKSLIHFYLKDTSSNNEPINDNLLNMATLKEKAELIINNFEEFEGNYDYSKFSKDCEDLSVEGEVTSEVMVSKVHLYFRRLHNGRIVRKNISCIEVVFDSNMNIIEFTAKWPEFEKITDGNKVVSVKKPLDNAIDGYMSLDSATKGNEEVVYIEQTYIIGLERSWFPVKQDDKIILTPVQTFVSRTYFNDGGSKMEFVDLPLLEKYY